MNSQPITDEQLRVKAKDMSEFFIHLFWFFIVNIILYIVDYMGNSRIDWAYWVTFGWGIGIISHTFGIFYSQSLEQTIYNRLKK